MSFSSSALSAEFHRKWTDRCIAKFIFSTSSLMCVFNSFLCDPCNLCLKMKQCLKSSKQILWDKRLRPCWPLYSLRVCGGKAVRRSLFLTYLCSSVLSDSQYCMTSGWCMTPGCTRQAYAMHAAGEKTDFFL